MVELVGSQNQIVKVLEVMMAKDTMTVAMGRYLSGGKAAPITFYRVGKAPLACLGPALAIWKPQQSEGSNRTLWIRIHPSISAALVEEINKAREMQGCSDVSVRDITTDLVAFELLGGQSTPLLASILAPNVCDSESPGGKVLSTIANVPCPASLPEGSVIALRIHDPRLRFPYGLIKTDKRQTEDEQKALANLMLHWPKTANQVSSNSNDSGIWDIVQTRSDLERRATEHQLNERRHAILVPGSKLTPDPQIDVTVPLLLVRTGPEALLGSPSSSLDSEYVNALAHGWTVIAPRGWGMPLWLSFIFAGARAQGYQERHHIAFEAGLPVFPLHWPGTRSYDDWTGPAAHDDYLRWSRRPMAKRENYLKYGVASPFFPPFHQLLGLKDVPAQYPVVSSDDLECRKDRVRAIKEKMIKEEENSSQDVEMQAAADERSSVSDQIWMATGEQLAVAIRKMLKQAKSDALTFEQWAGPVLAHLPDPAATQLLDKCLVRVRLEYSGRGTPDKNARICICEEDDRQIGYAMTGSFSLARGSGMAIGACSLRGLYDMWNRGSRSVVVKNNDGGPTRSAHLKVLP
ncbi:Ribonucleases P/MRP protein subunit pop1 [Linderina macrospora]|uniref:Ribonucleases P/MRP protein subunit pop1 n=1 Tax=Linderina macrospora TaxID=4868 RepID=A0ACC1JDB0_9FUNG|nr:Ribonucleases P/MRP protein subunit pop1 [Linderina macrospora]